MSLEPSEPVTGKGPDPKKISPEAKAAMELVDELAIPDDEVEADGTPKDSRLSFSMFPQAFWRRQRWQRWRRWGIPLAFLLLIYWFVPHVWELRTGPVTVTHWEKIKGETTAVVGPQMPTWIPSKRISRHVLHAFVAAEDGRFYEHNGLDFNEMWKSFQTNIKKKRYARGGSTITQQVVKMAFLDREKSLLRKAREATGALLLEMILPKDRILEWYINLVEFGDGIYGIKQGCWYYFRTKPELLTIEQAVHLSLVLPSPNAWSLGLRRKSLTNFGHKRFASILNHMRGSGYITKGQWAQALARGDFGRPVHGYAKYLAAQRQNKPICPGSPGCPDEIDAVDDEESLSDEETLTYPHSDNQSNQSNQSKLPPAPPSEIAPVLSGVPTPSTSIDTGAQVGAPTETETGANTEDSENADSSATTESTDEDANE